MSLTVSTSEPIVHEPAVQFAAPEPPAREPEPVFPEQLEIVAWTDPSFEHSGHDPRSAYVERFWLGLLGPSTTWMLRRFARGLDEFPDGFRVDLVDTGRALGLGESMARNSTTQRSVLRACQFGAAYRINPQRLAVRSHLPTLTRRQVSRLPESLQRAHVQWATRPTDPAELRRATAAVAGLVEAGERIGEIERQLRRWGYPPQTVRDAVGTAMGWG
ncbi:MAG: hypothetical protein U0Q22_05510 [Acidimicrobiales bacterium]